MHISQVPDYGGLMSRRRIELFLVVAAVAMLGKIPLALSVEPNAFIQANISAAWRQESE